MKSINYIPRCGFANRKLLHVLLQMICVFHIQFVIVIESLDALEKYEPFQKKRYSQVVSGYVLYVTWQISFKTRDLLPSVKEDFLISHVGKRRPRFPAPEHWLVIVTLSVNGQKGSRKRTRTCKRSKWMEKGKHRLSAVMGVSGKKRRVCQCGRKWKWNTKRANFYESGSSWKPPTARRWFSKILCAIVT